MADEPLKCPRCGWPVNPGETVCESCGQSLTSDNQSDTFGSLAPPQAPSLACSNCHAIWSPTTRICPVCGNDLYMAGYSPVGTWPPVITGQTLLNPSSAPLMTRSRAGDIAIGVVAGLVSCVLAPFSLGITLLHLLVVCRKAFNTYPYYRRGVYYGAVGAMLVLMSPFVYCLGGFRHLF